jgi:peptidoglycan/xylan/chitin deacetylase (PgdA/CDA1 family)
LGFITHNDSLDWKEYGVDHEVKTVLQNKNLSNGSIILFHNDAKYTPEALRPILDGLKEQGYEIVPISELIIRDDYYMDHTGRQMRK